jgi:hypothetical protein
MQMALEASIGTWLEAFNHLRKGFHGSLVCSAFKGVFDVNNIIQESDASNVQRPTTLSIQ